jgi:ATP-dependent Lon protease
MGYFVSLIKNVPSTLDNYVYVLGDYRNTAIINDPVYDRLDKRWMEDYKIADKVEIAKRGALAQITIDAGLTADSVAVDDSVLTHIAKRYGWGAGFRSMEKALQRIVGACAREVLAKGVAVSQYKKTYKKVMYTRYWASRL